MENLKLINGCRGVSSWKLDGTSGSVFLIIFPYLIFNQEKTCNPGSVQGIKETSKELSPWLRMLSILFNHRLIICTGYSTAVHFILGCCRLVEVYYGSDWALCKFLLFSVFQTFQQVCSNQNLSPGAR